MNRLEPWASTTIGAEKHKKREAINTKRQEHYEPLLNEFVNTLRAKLETAFPPQNKTISIEHNTPYHGFDSLFGVVTTEYVHETFSQEIESARLINAVIEQATIERKFDLGFPNISKKPAKAEILSTLPNYLVGRITPPAENTEFVTKGRKRGELSEMSDELRMEIIIKLRKLVSNAIATTKQQVPVPETCHVKS